MSAGGFSATRLVRVRDLVERMVGSGFVPGLMVVLARHGDVHVEAAGTLAFEGPGAGVPMGRDTIVRMASMTKPVVAACAMTLVEDCTLRLDDPVDELLPELADMRVLADPDGPLEDTVPAIRSITLRDLLTFTPGTGMVIAEPGTVPIADALDAIGEPHLDEWVRRLGALPLVHRTGNPVDVRDRRRRNRRTDRPGHRHVLGEALRERICEPLGMRDTAFSVDAERLGRFATAYDRDSAPTGEAVVSDLPDGMFSKPPTFEGGGGARLDRRRLPCLRFGTARRRHPPRAAGSLAALDDPHHHGSVEPGAEGGVRILAGVFRQPGLGVRDVGRHPANPPGTFGRQLRLVRFLWHVLVQRSR